MIPIKRMVPVLAIAIVSSCTVTAFLGGCGGGDDDSAYRFVSNPAEFLGRSFNGSVPVDAGRVAAVAVQVASNGTATGAVTLSTRSQSIPGSGRAVLASGTATGTVNTRTGEFRLSGTYNDRGAQPFTITGILPSSANASEFTLNLGGGAFVGRLNAVGASPSPLPSPSSSPGASPSPGTSPSPSPTASASPSPSPSPSGTPGSSLTSRFYPLRTGDTFTYTTTSSGNSTDYTTRTGNLSTFKGNSAFRREDLEANGSIGSVSYVNVTTAGYTAFGTEQFSDTGAIESTSEFVPPFTIPASVLNGSAGSFSYASNIVNSDGTTGQISFEGTATPLGRESVTVPAGTFNALKVRIQSTIRVTGSGQTLTTNSDSTEYLVEDVGMVKSETTATSSFGTSISTQVLKSASVGGRVFP